MTVTINGSGTITGVSTLGTTVVNQTLTTPTVTSTMGVGNATPAASGAGITFPASQSASTDVNTLDDYEEGTFSVTVTGAGGNPTYTNTESRCLYTKIGNTVLVQGRVAISSISGGSGNLRFSGFPFAVSGGSSGNPSWHTLTLGYRADSANVFGTAMMIPYGSTYAEFWKFSSTTNPQSVASSSVIVSDIGTTLEVYFGGTYTTTT